jgi:RNA-binding, Nab2-type zinc finger
MTRIFLLSLLLCSLSLTLTLTLRLIAEQKSFTEIESELYQFDTPAPFIAWLRPYVDKSVQQVSPDVIMESGSKLRASTNLFKAAIKQVHQTDRGIQKKDVPKEMARPHRMELVPSSNSSSGVLRLVPQNPRVLPSQKPDVFSRLGRKAGPYEMPPARKADQQMNIATTITSEHQRQVPISQAAYISPASLPAYAPPVANAVCKFGAYCSRADCPYAHPSPAAQQKQAHQSASYRSVAPPCRFYPHCTNPACPFTHPVNNKYQNRALNLNVTNVACKFASLCHNPHCQYLHLPISQTSQRVFALDEADVVSPFDEYEEMDVDLARSVGVSFSTPMSGSVKRV